MAERLTISMIEEEVKVYDEYIEIPFTTKDKEIKVRLYPFFSPVTIRDIVVDLSEFLNNVQKENVNYDDKEFDDVVAYFILRHCTDIKFTKSKKAKTLYKEFKTVIKSKNLQSILNLIPEESIQEVYDRIFKEAEFKAKFIDQIKQIQEQIKELPLGNRDILFGEENNANESVE